MDGSLVAFTSIAYLCTLFAIAYFGDKRAEQGRSLTQNPYIYTLSIAVFCTSWTFYGSVGLAARSGLDFLPIYIGPTLVFVLWSVVWVKIVRICKVNRITSIADFISSRYGKSSRLGGLVALVAVIGTTPYISLQLKSIATSFEIITNYSGADGDQNPVFGALGLDSTFLIALTLAIFSILFGTRHIDASEHHEGIVTAIAFESIVKLFAFLAVGLFVTFGVYNGFTDLFQKAEQMDLQRLFTVNPEGGYATWVSMIILSMLAIICLPRQFYITAVENTDENHLRTAVWLFPTYLLVLNIFVLPIAISGRMAFAQGGVDVDMFVLTVPIFYGQTGLALLAFIGGLSAATSMVIVAAIALSTMVCNNIVVPVLVNWRWVDLEKRGDLTGLLLLTRRASIIGILILGYGYFRIASGSYSLVTIGLVSFTAAAQFAPAILGGMFWKGASLKGAMTGLALGILVWSYTLLMPSFAQSGWLPISFIDYGPFGLTLLKPYALFGMTGFDTISHALFWSMFANLGAYIVVSLLTSQTTIERIQGTMFVDVFLYTEGLKDSRFLQGSASIGDLRDLVGRFVGEDRATQAFETFASEQGVTVRPSQVADTAWLDRAEKMLAGAVGSATARVMIGSVVKGGIVSLDEMYKILDETSQAIQYSRMLETKSRELEETTFKLQSANERLKELDSLKDDFLNTISHELRTPLTSIRAFSEILSETPDISEEETSRFLMVIRKESERLTRLIDQILDLAKMESGQMDWSLANVDSRPIIEQAVAGMSGLMQERKVKLKVDLPAGMPMIKADHDQLVQVLINLLSNAVKFCRHSGGYVRVSAKVKGGKLWVSVSDNGDGIPDNKKAEVFVKFHQFNQGNDRMPRGTGLGLAICREIITFLGGHIWVEDNDTGPGACFTFTVPLSRVDGYLRTADEPVTNTEVVAI
ncbi:sensor histidine kinase [Magnetovibrio blakemorei]|uniref:histidine kinase n=1 Tax=Magnetovibrio blakemorei TaxID=28181 RepID=A0A1E5Q8A4_9PROT|nr:sensor histidine kinase [Magnetovibrio blakemorei]OEJ67585.1 histidine kinase [Magnetovibrio blakemorei]